MANQPKVRERPHVRIMFQFGGLAGVDYGYLYTKLEFRGMVNGGYIVRAELGDPSFNLINKLIEEGYLKDTRSKPVPVKFQILSGDKGTYPETATRPQTAIILSLNVKTGPGDIGYIEFVAIDPPSWFLNMGDAAGSVFKGRVDQVIKKVINQYAPSVNADVGRTIDSEQNRFWMMRQDPKTFLSSLMDWSASITQRKTQWLVEVDGYDMLIKEQAALISRQRAFYRFFASSDHDTILKAALTADNALSAVQSKLVTSGCSAISGQYLDKITDEKEEKVFVKDSTTGNKQVAKANNEQSFTKPPDAKPTRVGWSAVTSIPELYSAGDLGLRLDEYVDGRPRAMWLNMVNNLLKAKFTTIGHGEWSDCRGLGVDTIFVKWTSGKGESGDEFWWVTGNWLVYGFHHIVTRAMWNTEVYCARFDYDAAARKVGGGG
ncbi:MAG: hypothetical protein EKK63_14380 [Acinetobacter sp.]|uniref:hypothetical protein n=1 Tax=Acinetobacter sp. TaxID=472 RepID=UPI000FBDC010|nr:hypothetical protein [Acinetobacter sp.]RUP37662.1 MAG: hypothetical protein EKK63_14380 [Acinetobacter sp.]